MTIPLEHSGQPFEGQDERASPISQDISNQNSNGDLGMDFAPKTGETNGFPEMAMMGHGHQVHPSQTPGIDSTGALHPSVVQWEGISPYKSCLGDQNMSEIGVGNSPWNSNGNHDNTQQRLPTPAAFSALYQNVPGQNHFDEAFPMELAVQMRSNELDSHNSAGHKRFNDPHFDLPASSKRPRFESGVSKKHAPTLPGAQFPHRTEKAFNPMVNYYGDVREQFAAGYGYQDSRPDSFISPSAAKASAKKLESVDPTSLINTETCLPASSQVHSETRLPIDSQVHSETCLPTDSQVHTETCLPTTGQGVINAEVIDLTSHETGSKIPKEGKAIVTIGMVRTTASLRQIPHFGTLAKVRYTPVLPVTIRKRYDHSKPFLFDIFDGANLPFGQVDHHFALYLHQIVTKITLGSWSFDKFEAKLVSRPIKDLNGRPEGSRLPGALPWPMEVHINVPKYFADTAIGLIGNGRKGIRLLPPISTRFTAYQKDHQEHLEQTRLAPKPKGNPTDHVSLEINEGVIGNIMDTCMSHEDLPEAENPVGITTELKAHQKQGLSFMLNRELDPRGIEDGWARNSFWVRETSGWVHELTGIKQQHAPTPARGGILADDMGLGKTLSMLSLIVASLPESYKFAQDSSQGRVRATLIVVPKSTIDANWLRQMGQHTESGKLKVVKWVGTNREVHLKEIANSDVVLTTYGQLLADGKSRFPFLRRFYWFRIILDEAHMIRNADTLNFTFCSKIQAERRWAITGTPIQNSLEDFASLLRFLHVSPFTEHPEIFRQCWSTWLRQYGTDDTPAPLRALVDMFTLRRTKAILSKGDGSLPPKYLHRTEVELNSQERDAYKCLEAYLNNEFMTDKVRREAKIKFNSSRGNGKYLKLLTIIRLFLAHKDELVKPEDQHLLQGSRHRPVVIDDDDFGPTDFDGDGPIHIYEQFITSGDSACCNCDTEVVPYDDEEDKDSEGMIFGCVTRCGYLLCVNCGLAWCESQYKCGSTEKFDCRYCLDKHERKEDLAAELYSGRVHRYRERQMELYKSRLADKLSLYTGPSAKVRFLLKKLDEIDGLDPETRQPNKAVVFTFWSQNLDLIELALREKGIKSSRLDGSMGSLQRQHALEEFEQNPEVRVFLATVGAGGVGLNLVAANHVFIMEPQWNPQAEEQAVDRVHRIGQNRRVHVWKLITKDSLEVEIAAMAERKKTLAIMALHRGGKQNGERDSAMMVIRARLETNAEQAAEEMEI